MYYSEQNSTIWTSLRTRNGVEYVMAGNCYSSIQIDQFETISLILRHGYGIQRIVYNDLDMALDDAEQHYAQECADYPYMGDRELSVA